MMGLVEEVHWGLHESLLLVQVPLRPPPHFPHPGEGLVVAKDGVDTEVALLVLQISLFPGRLATSD